MPLSKLRGAARTAHEAKIARQQAGTDRANQDPIERERALLEPESSVPNPTLDATRLRLENYQPSDDADKTGQRLSAFLDVLPADGRQNLIRDVLSRNDSELRTFIGTLRKSLFLPMKAAGGNTPVASSTSSSSSKPTQRVGQAKLRKNCLLRDNYRCMLTYAYDFNEAKLLSGEEKQGLITADTQCSHVFPYSTGPKARGGELHRVELDRISRLWAFVYRYFPTVESRLDIREPGIINSPRNALTMADFMHAQFGTFRLSLEHVNDHTYNIKTFESATAILGFLPQNRKVQFETSTEFELPDPELLKVHHAIAKFFHASGMGSELDDEDDNEVISVAALPEMPANRGV